MLQYPSERRAQKLRASIFEGQSNNGTQKKKDDNNQLRKPLKILEGDKLI